jgi:hypothetical protein
MALDLVGRGVDRDPAADQAAHRVAPLEDVEREGEQRLDLGRIRSQVELGGVGDAADEGVDAVAGDEGRGGGEGAAEIDVPGGQCDLLLGLAQRGPRQVGVARVVAPAWE